MKRAGPLAARRAASVIAVSLGMALAGASVPAADSVVERHPLSQGRPLTPAGRFVPDLTT